MRLHKTFIFFIFSLGILCHTSLYAEMSSYDLNKPVGWATVSSTPTGGEGGTCVTVDNANDLVSALKKDGKAVIYIKGAIQFTTFMKAVVKDKTIIGLPGSYLYSNEQTSSTSGILYFSSGTNNVIMRNVTFIGPGAYDCDGYDNFCIDASTNIWVDHCDFQDGCDGNFDCKNGSNNIAVTWCRFRYLKAPKAGGSGGAADHRYTNLWGSSDSNDEKDSGKLNTTFMFCWWDQGCRERMPRVRFGKVHIINCLYNSTVANYCCGAGKNSSIFVENTAFIGVNNPYADYSNEYNAYLTFNNCLFKNCKGDTTGTGGAFTPSTYYQLKAIDASLVEGVVSNNNNGAGAILNVVECQGVVNGGGGQTQDDDATLTKTGTGNENQSVNVNTAIVDFGYTWNNAPEATVTGLPVGINATINANNKTITICGTPTEVGTFYFTVSTTGATKNATLVGSIIVTEAGSSTFTEAPTLTKRGSGSSSQTINIGEPIVSFGYSWTNATSIEFTGLPAGLTVTANGTDRMDISGTPTEAGAFNFTVKTIGGISEVSKSGTIKVNETTNCEEATADRNYIRLASQFVNEEATLLVKANGKINVRIYDAFGRICLTLEEEIFGESALIISTQDLNPGIYLIESNLDGDRLTERMLISK